MINIAIFVDGQQSSEFEGKEDAEISIGRSPGCVVRLANSSVSRLHAVIRYTDEGSWLIEKKTTKNIVLLNGEEIENAILEGGEEIVIANFTLRINIVELKEKEGLEAASAINEEAISETNGRTKISQTMPKAYLRFQPGTASCTEFLIENESTLIGRGSACNIILYDKQCSREHLQLNKRGLNFHIVDLNTVNGTYVNEKKIKEYELHSEDIIKIGELEFSFNIEQSSLEQLQDNIQLPIPFDDLEPIIPAEEEELEEFNEEAEKTLSEEDDIANEKSLVKKRWKQFKRLPKIRRYIILLAILALIPIIFSKENNTSKPKQSIDSRAYQNLSPKKKKYIRETYRKAIIAKEKGLYTEVLDHLTKLFKLIDNYKDAKFYEREAKNQVRKAKIQEKKEAQARLERKRQENIKKHEEMGEILFQEALNDPSKRIDLENLIQKIYTIDPNNLTAQTWKSKIIDKVEQEKRDKELAEEKRLLAERAESELNKLKEIIKKKEYYKAIKYSKTLKKYKGIYEKNAYMDRIEEAKTEAKTLLHSLTEPLIRDAARNRMSGGDLVKSKEAYREVLRLEPDNQKAILGLKNIRSLLHLQAKRLYAQAILAESVTSLDEALDKFKKCVKVAPERDIYKRRCKSKMIKYEAFEK